MDVELLADAVGDPVEFACDKEEVVILLAGFVIDWDSDELGDGRPELAIPPLLGEVIFLSGYGTDVLETVETFGGMVC